MNYVPADVILHGQAVFDPYLHRAGPLSLAVKGPRIVAAGRRREIEPLAGRGTEVIELPGGLIIPGFHDFHIHLFAGSLTAESADLHSARNEQEAARIAADFARAHPEKEWVLGFNWYHVFWENAGLPHRKSLDRLIPDRPVFLFNAEYHGARVNSKALDLCGIDRNTPDPPFGAIERDASGDPTGFLYETAMGLVGKTALDLPGKDKERLLRSFNSHAASVGVTSVHDMLPLPGMSCGDPEVYASFEGRDELGVRIFLEADLAGSLEDARQLRRRYTSDMLRFSGLKQFVDGVATTYTAFMVAPYTDRPDTRGGTLIPAESLTEWVARADAEGFRVRLHACGDAAVRTALDAYEHARRLNGRRDSRHTIEHIETIHPHDFDRLARLEVIASVQPEHLAMTERFEDTPYRDRMGLQRERYLWPNRSLQLLGTRLCYGSDFPVVGLDPLKGLYRAVTRVHDDGNPPDGWVPQERVTVAGALSAYTFAGARGSFMENRLGLLRPGFLADIAVLDRNILDGPPEDILKAKNILTLSNGRIVHRDTWEKTS